MKLKVWDLFAGVGGFSLGLHRTGGFETTLFVEIEPFCQKVLQKNFPGIPIHDDIKTLDCERYERPDVITGGYPCQPFSVAGKRLAEEDERHLWPELFRVICTVRPRWVIAENVSGHIKLGLDTVISQMEAEGYTVWVFVLPACAVGAPHRRDRVWIICHAKHDGQPATEVTGSPREGSNDSKARQNETGEPERPNIERSSMAHTKSNTRNYEYSTRSESSEIQKERFNGSSQDVPYTTSTRQPGQGQPFQRGSEAENGEGQADYAESMCIGDFWRTEPAVCGISDGLPDGLYKGRVATGVKDRTARLKALGNAIVPQIATVIGEAILETHDL